LNFQEYVAQRNQNESRHHRLYDTAVAPSLTVSQV